MATATAQGTRHLPLCFRQKSCGALTSRRRGEEEKKKKARSLFRGKGSHSCFRARALSEREREGYREATQAIDWDNLGFSSEHVPKTSMFLATASVNSESGEWVWKEEDVQPYRQLSLDPSAQVLNYGQSIFEGMKAHRTSQGNLVLFRPEENAKRMAEGAARMSMAPPPRDLFLKGVKEVVKANAEYIPPHGKGSLYIRPLLLGTGAILGLGPAPSYTFLIYCSPVGGYFKGGQLTPISLKVEEVFHRAAPGGTGNTKCAGNYSPVLSVQLEAKAKGFNDVLYLDAVHNKYVEEVSSCNIFAVFGKKLVTPSLGTILPGVTRKSIIDLAREKGFEVEEKPLSIEEVLSADECFTCGTAVVLSPVGYIEYGEKKKKYTGDDNAPGPVALDLYETLSGIQQKAIEDPFNWVVDVV